MIITILRKPLEGSVADNALKHGCGAINIDTTRVGTEDMVSRSMGSLGVMHDDNWQSKPIEPTVSKGRWPANFILTHLEGCTSHGEDWDCVEGCPVKELDQQSGNRKTTWVSTSHKNNRQGDFLGALGHPKDQGYNDEGGASWFFKQFKKDNDQ
jgi:hypothetical protein